MTSVGALIIDQLRREGLTTKYSLLSIHVLMILNVVKRESNKEPFLLNAKEKESLNEAKILVDKMRAGYMFIEDACEERGAKTEKEGYVSEGMTLGNIVSRIYHETDCCESKFFDSMSRSLWLLIGDFLLDDSKLEELHTFFDKFQKELSLINNASRY